MKNLAFLFPGQGSQSIGMLQEITKKNPELIEYFNQASTIVGYDVFELVHQDPNNNLNKTEFTQTALFTVNHIAYHYALTHGYVPIVCSGHSLGEYNALVCAKVISFDDGVRLVHKRGQLMSNASNHQEGMMGVIIGLSNEVVEELCRTISTNDNIVEPANYNSKGQIVVSGDKRAVLEAMRVAKEQGARLTKKINVSVPSHCSKMEKISNEFLDTLTNIKFNLPTIDVISNVDANAYKTVEDIKSKLSKQLYKPVYWEKIIQIIFDKYTTNFLECGPGKVLTGLNNRIDKKINSVLIQEVM